MSTAAQETLERLQELTAGRDSGDKKGYIALDALGATPESIQMDKMTNPQKEAMLAEFERRKRARQLTLPTDDYQVKALLRQINQPICMFGEDKPDRRERLRKILSLMDEEEAHRILRREEPRSDQPKEEENTWYHEGSEALRQARQFIARYSLPRAKQRLEKARELKDCPPQQRAIRIQETHKWIRNIANYCSQVGDTRPVAYCEFSPDSKYIATAGWSGMCKLWAVPDCSLVRAYQGHNDSAGCIRFHPESTISMSSTELNLASCSHDGSIKLWNLESELPIADIEGHAPYRVSRLAFHPSGRFLATCCFDKSWRLFDLEQNEEVLFQEGHSKAVYDIAFQCDGSVALTGGLDAYGRIWDLRTGRCIMFLEGHQRDILSVEFLPNGFQMVTGAADNNCKIWDLRMRRCIYTVPAHHNVVSKVFVDSKNGDYMLTGSYDCTIKMWTNPGWQPLKTLLGHESKVMCVAISRDGEWIASASYDRTFKLWCSEK